MADQSALPKLLPGYAEKSSRRWPKEPETVVLGDEEIANAKFVGCARIDGRHGWLCFRLGRTYYFQIQN